MKILILLTIVGLFSINIFAQKTPTFSNYKVTVEKATAQKINLASHRKAKQFRTNLKEALSEGKVNFAGKFIIAEWGCGSGCTQAAIIDAQTGNVFFPDVLWQVIAGSTTLGDHELLDYKNDSRLLILAGYVGINGGDSEKFQHGIFYLEWTGTNFKLLKFVKKPIAKV